MRASDEDASDAAIESFGFPLATAAAAAALAGLGIVGFFGPPWPPVLALSIVELGAVAAGLIEAKLAYEGLRALLVAAFSWAVFGVTCAAATIWYAEGRTHVSKYELLIPAAIAAVPFAVVRLIIWLATRRQRAAKRAAERAAARPGRAWARPSWRAEAPDVILAAAVFMVPFGGWAVSKPRVADAQALAEKVRTHHVLTFVTDGQGGVRHDGLPVDKEAIEDLCRRAAAADPATEVRIMSGKQPSKGGLERVAYAAEAAHLSWSLYQDDR